MPTEAALRPVASATSPLRMIAKGNPLPAFSVVSPSAAKRPVPMIMAAVRNVAVVRPSVRTNDALGASFSSAAACVMFGYHQSSAAIFARSMVRRQRCGLQVRAAARLVNGLSLLLLWPAPQGRRGSLGPGLRSDALSKNG